MAHTFDFGLDLEHQQDGTTKSPETSIPASQQSPRKSSQRRWSASTDGSKVDHDNIHSAPWEAPPVPPIPPDQPQEAWRKRSLKRDSYTSQMSLRMSESGTRPQTATLDYAAFDGEARQSILANDVGAAPRSPRRLTKRTSRLAIDIREKCQYEELHWQVSGLNPQGWHRRRKWMHTLAAGGVAFTVLFSSSIVAPASGAIETSFGASPIVAVLSTPLYVLGLAFGSMLGTVSAALVGRKVAQSSSLLLSVAFSIASACVDSFAALHACRFFAGLFASPALWISLAVLFEMWTMKKLAVPMIAFTAIAFAGMTLGPIAGSYIIESQDVRWTQYTIIIACAVALALMLAMRETHKNTVQRRRREGRASRPSFRDIVGSAVTRPLAALFKNPTVLLLSIHTGAIFGTFYTAFTVFPSIFATAYDFSLSEQGLTILSLVIGVILGAILLALNHTFIYRPRVARWKQHYDAEVERALAEEKQLKRRSRRNSRASSKLPKRKSATSLFSASASASNAGSRLSLIQAFTKRDSRSDLVSTLIDFEDKNVALSIAAAEYLNSVNQKRILPERVLLILSKQPPYGEMCEQLESYGLNVDRVRLAQVFLDALQNQQQVQQQQQTETRPVTAATLEDARPMTTPRPALTKSQSTWTLLSHTSPTFKAPPVWRLWPVLPASVMAAGGLFLFAWTSRGSIHWVVPLNGLGLFAASGVTVLVSIILYMLENYGEDAVAGGSVLMWFLAAAFPVFGVPMFRALETGVAGSVLGGLAVMCCVPVWVVVVKGGKGK